ncbi:hypothetical protein SARC_17059, partial [Sphaeroforma arctica JP610]
PRKSPTGFIMITIKGRRLVSEPRSITTTEAQSSGAQVIQQQCIVYMQDVALLSDVRICVVCNNPAHGSCSNEKFDRTIGVSQFTCNICLNCIFCNQPTSAAHACAICDRSQH